MVRIKLAKKTLNEWMIFFIIWNENIKNRNYSIFLVLPNFVVLTWLMTHTVCPNNFQTFREPRSLVSSLKYLVRKLFKFSLHMGKTIATTIWNSLYFKNSKKDSFCGNYLRKYGMWGRWVSQFHRKNHLRHCFFRKGMRKRKLTWYLHKSNTYSILDKKSYVE